MTNLLDYIKSELDKIDVSEAIKKVNPDELASEETIKLHFLTKLFNDKITSIENKIAMSDPYSGEDNLYIEYILFCEMLRISERLVESSLFYSQHRKSLHISKISFTGVSISYDQCVKDRKIVMIEDQIRSELLMKMNNSKIDLVNTSKQFQ